MQGFRELKLWKKSHELTLEIYRVSKSFPRQEQYGITNQLRRASSSVAANLAEGCVRGGDAEFARFAQIALGSASETEYFLLLARDLGFLNSQDYGDLETKVTEVKRMLTSLIHTLKGNR